MKESDIDIYKERAHLLIADILPDLGMNSHENLCDGIQDLIEIVAKKAMQEAVAAARAEGVKEGREQMLADRIKDIEIIISLCKTLRHQFPNDISLQMTQEQHERELKKIESLRQPKPEQKDAE